jgi:3,4-dihydroxy 2-butanone 4-phosphate synthase/GTP cyclohydrolase II
MKLIAERGRGVVVIIREPTKTSLSRFIQERDGQPLKKSIAELRQYGIGAQILLDLGVKNMILVTNAQRSIVGLNGYGITLVGQEPIPKI